MGIKKRLRAVAAVGSALTGLAQTARIVLPAAEGRRGVGGVAGAHRGCLMQPTSGRPPSWFQVVQR